MEIAFDNIGALQIFVFVADTRSFKAAGARMGLTSSAIGKAVQKLEQQLDVALFHRTTRSLSMTEQGEVLLDSARRILGEMEAVQLRLAQSTATPRGRLKVSMPAAISLFAPMFGAFQSHHPDVALDLDFNDRFVDVVEEGYDLVLRSGEPNDSRLRHKRLGRFVLRLVAAPSYLARAGTPARVCDLADHLCLRHRYAATGKVAPWPFAGEDGDTAVPTSLTSTLVDALSILAENGEGIAALPHFLVDQQIADGRLIEVLPGRLQRQDNFVLLWPPSRYPQPKVRAFIDFAASWLATRLI